MNLTEHFTYEELWHSDTALRLGIDNTPPPELLPRLRQLAMGLELIRGIVRLPVHVNSGFRCEELEKVLCRKDFIAWCGRRGVDAFWEGGTTINNESWSEYFERKGHPQGYCADITCSPFGTPRQLLQAIVRDGQLKFDQLIEEGTWAHVSVDPRMRGEILIATFTNGVPAYERVETL